MAVTAPLKVIVTGATGMVGEGVLMECLKHPLVEAVLIINRKPSGITHPKLKEILHADFYDFSSIEDQLSGYNACFFCLGVSSVGMKEDKYYHLTYDLTLHVAQTLSRHNPDMTFCYISGSGTDSTERGRTMWVRVKGKTENDLMKLPFKEVYAVRPGLIRPTKGQKHVWKFYYALDWLFPIVKAISSNAACTMRELGLSMIVAASQGFAKPHIEVRDIVELARKG